MPNAIAFAPLLFTLQFLIYHARRRRVKRFLIGRLIEAREAMPAQFARHGSGDIVVDLTGHPVTSRIKAKPMTLLHMPSSSRMDLLVIIMPLELPVITGEHVSRVIGRYHQWRRWPILDRGIANFGVKDCQLIREQFERARHDLAPSGIITGDLIWAHAIEDQATAGIAPCSQAFIAYRVTSSRI
jgi:hypothetical protein